MLSKNAWKETAIGVLANISVDSVFPEDREDIIKFQALYRIWLRNQLCSDEITELLYRDRINNQQDENDNTYRKLLKEFLEKTAQIGKMVEDFSEKEQWKHYIVREFSRLNQEDTDDSQLQIPIEVIMTYMQLKEKKAEKEEEYQKIQEEMISQGEDKLVPAVNARFDWHCESCGQINEATRMLCFDCGAQRNIEFLTIGELHKKKREELEQIYREIDQMQKEIPDKEAIKKYPLNDGRRKDYRGQWHCIYCGNINTRYENVCHSCGKKKI